MGIPEARAPVSTTGVHIGLSSIEPRTHTRSYAVTAYFAPASTRTNLFVLTTAYAHKLVTTGQGDGNIVATGVEFSYGDEKRVHVAHAKREVIISAGALKSPQILELSGIGREDVLSKIGVPVKIPLDGVGGNVQEHTFIGTVYELKEDTTTETLDMLRDEKVAAQHIELLAKGEGAFTAGFTNVAWVPLADVTSRSQALYEQEKKQIEEDVKNSSGYPPGLLEQYDIQLERIPNGHLDCEIAVTATFLGAGMPPIEGKKYVSIAIFLNHAFSRGTIHSSSNDPLVDPEIDPHYWEHQIDRDILLEGIKYARKIAQASPLRDEIAYEYIPGPAVDTDEKLAEWGKDALGSTWHTAGSCSMLPREKNGVVDTHLKVYGTKNIRVVDLSIVPLNIAAHTQATVYTIAELASDIIKGKFSP
ncbi:hypothetical protein PM082_006478 [Marasmius tenuissimus]|nr:hypothetical protein PM082_006478 [Marasmius tenuissimus]